MKKLIYGALFVICMVGVSSMCAAAINAMFREYETVVEPFLSLSEENTLGFIGLAISLSTLILWATIAIAAKIINE